MKAYYIIILTLFINCIDLKAQISTDSKSIRIEIRDSLLFVNDDSVSYLNVVEYFENHFGKPNRKRRGYRYKWRRYIYDDLGITIMTHPKSISISFSYHRLLKSDSKKDFLGFISVNGVPIHIEYSFEEIISKLYPCKFHNLFNRSLIGTFFSFEKGLSSENLFEINWHYIPNQSDRIKFE